MGFELATRSPAIRVQFGVDGRGNNFENFDSGTGEDLRSFQRFWEGAIRWLVRDPTLTHLRIDLDKVEYRCGQTVSLRVWTLRADYTPAAAVEVAIELLPAEAAEGAAALPSLRVTTGNDGEAQGELDGLDPGAYRLVGKAELDGRATQEQTTFVIHREGHELDDVLSIAIEERRRGVWPLSSRSRNERDRVCG